ncbi:MAG: DUF86 domain-containing protein [Chloroflexia bacterium]|nr:DUF86 domain-containing protein [Chloroflexia bacterium]
MKPAVIKRLRDVLAACDRTARFTAGRSLDDYLTDELLRAGVERQIGIIGEALNYARRLDPSLADRLPRLHQGIAMRHRIIHGYAEIDDELVWMTSQLRIPQLRKQIALLLEDMASDDETMTE